MNKIQIIFLSFIFLSCGMNDNVPKKIAEDILSSDIKLMDSVFEVNRPITSYYIDNVIKKKPSVVLEIVKIILIRITFYI